MSGKIDQSLDEIASARSAGRRRPQQRRSTGRPTPAAPVGGIHKSAKPARGAATKPAPARAAPTNTESKIIVSNLPKDVSELQIKEYFAQSVGAIKRVELSYGPNSQSRGIANVIFQKSDGASKAFQMVNGLLVDNRPIKIEIVVGAAQANKIIPTAKTLAERTTQPKNQPKAQPKSAATDKPKVTGGRGAAAKAGPGKKPARRARNPRPAKKTAEELDSEMADYFQGNGNNASNENAAATGAAAAPAAAAGDAAMEDEIM